MWSFAGTSAGVGAAISLTDFLEEVRQKCRFENWFFGHYHDNCVVEKKYVLLYEQMVALR